MKFLGQTNAPTRPDLEDCRAWLLREQLPPGWSFDEIVAIVDYALEGDAEALKYLKEENEDLKAELEVLA
jgi:hypothetical protein